MGRGSAFKCRDADSRHLAAIMRTINDVEAAVYGAEGSLVEGDSSSSINQGVIAGGYARAMAEDKFRDTWHYILARVPDGESRAEAVFDWVYVWEVVTGGEDGLVISGVTDADLGGSGTQTPIDIAAYATTSTLTTATKVYVLCDDNVLYQFDLVRASSAAPVQIDYVDQVTVTNTGTVLHCCVDGSGNVYVSVSDSTDVIKKYDSSLSLQATFGSTESISFNAAGGALGANSTHVFVMDDDNYLVRKYTTAGVSSASWGSNGTGNGEFGTPGTVKDIWADGTDVFTLEEQLDAGDTSSRYQRFNASGTHQATKTLTGNEMLSFVKNNSSTRWVLEGYDTMYRFSSADVQLSTYTHANVGDTAYTSFVGGLAGSDDVRFLLLACSAGRLHRLNRQSDGTYKWAGRRFDRTLALTFTGAPLIVDLVRRGASYVLGRNSFGADVDDDDTVELNTGLEFVATYSAGEFLNGRIAIADDDTVYIAADHVTGGIYKMASGLTSATQLADSSTYDFNDIYVSPANDYVYGTTTGDQVKAFDSSGNEVYSWGSNGTGDGEFDDPFGIIVTNEGRVYVLDSGNDRIQVFTASGAFIEEQAVNSNAKWLIYDPANDEIIVLYDTGTELKTWTVSRTSTAAAQTVWKAYGSDGSSRDLNAGGAQLPLNALSAELHRTALQSGEVAAPFSTRMVEDVRRAVELLASSGSITNVATGNALTWDNGTDDDLYKSAVAPKIEDFNLYASKTHYWQRGLGEIAADSAIREIDIVELQLAAEFLARCVGINPTQVTD